MPVITLTDGSTKTFDHAVSVNDLAMSIGPGLAKACLAANVDGQLVDASFVIEQDANVNIITEKSPEGLEIIRHSCAHLLAHAVKELFPEAQVTIGPVIENGFYYDFHYPKGFNESNVEAIELRMHEIAKRSLDVERFELPRDEAIAYFESIGEQYKARIIAEIPADQTLSLYRQGDFTDLCRGPHVPNTKVLKAFKLTKVAGAYWRGDSSNEMLQRIYGTAWQDKKALADYLHMLEEAERRDHRKALSKMDLGHIEEIAPGMVFWHAHGWTIYQTILSYLSEKQQQAGYQQINTPQLVDVSLWKASGHLEKFGDDMFTLETSNRQYAVKPMNCPCHVQVFKHRKRSYRELPIRLAEYGTCHRNEPSGALHGIMRLRHFVQDDGHIFCTESQIHDEVTAFIDQLQEIYRDFGFNDLVVKLSTRPEKRVGSDEVWDKAESTLATILDQREFNWELLPGEGAFYGPKIEFHFRDCIGRMWQCGTAQLDFAMPERLKAAYIDEHGETKVPVMIHRATVGSIERFIGILLEQYADQLPLWLAPIQVMVLNITDDQAEYATKITNKLKKHGIKAHKDLRNEKINYKIRSYSIQHIPYMVVLGKNELENTCISVRSLSGRQWDGLSLDDFISRLDEEIAQRCVAGGSED